MVMSRGDVTLEGNGTQEQKVVKREDGRRRRRGRGCWRECSRRRN